MSTDKMNLLDYLPKEEKQRVLALIQRLSEETQSKNRYLALYNKIKQEYEDLLQKYNKLKDQNSYLKQQMHNSFSMISQVRANFKSNKEKSNAKKVQAEEWEDQNEDQNQENQQDCANQTILFHNNSNPPKPTIKSSLEKYKPPQTTIHKKNNHSNLQSSYLNNTLLSSAIKNKQVEDLKKEIKVLQQSKRKTDEKCKDVKDKYRLVDQIKNRYKNKNQGNSAKKSVQAIDLTNSFQNQECSEEEQDTQAHKDNIKDSIKNPKINSKIYIQKNDKAIVNKSKNLITQTSKDRKTKQIPISKGHIVTAEDYGDVLQMINCYNL